MLEIKGYTLKQIEAILNEELDEPRTYTRIYQVLQTELEEDLEYFKIGRMYIVTKRGLTKFIKYFRTLDDLPR